MVDDDQQKKSLCWRRGFSVLQCYLGSSAVSKDASQTRDCCVARDATLRAARPDPSLRKNRLFRMTTKLHHYRLLFDLRKDDNQRVQRQGLDQRQT
jgi:hypothetical protein